MRGSSKNVLYNKKSASTPSIKKGLRKKEIEKERQELFAIGKTVLTAFSFLDSFNSPKPVEERSSDYEDHIMLAFKVNFETYLKNVFSEKELKEITEKEWNKFEDFCEDNFNESFFLLEHIIQEEAIDEYCKVFTEEAAEKINNLGAEKDNL